jgi:hypothetical protein
LPVKLNRTFGFATLQVFIALHSFVCLYLLTDI